MASKLKNQKCVQVGPNERVYYKLHHAAKAAFPSPPTHIGHPTSSVSLLCTFVQVVVIRACALAPVSCFLNSGQTHLIFVVTAVKHARPVRRSENIDTWPKCNLIILISPLCCDYFILDWILFSFVVCCLINIILWNAERREKRRGTKTVRATN